MQQNCISAANGNFPEADVTAELHLKCDEKDLYEYSLKDSDRRSYR